MSAPELPVVECVIDIEAPGRIHVDDLEWATAAEGIPAVAIPWALLEDDGFQMAVKRRLLNGANEATVTQRGFFAAIAAELRARAGGA